MLYTNCQINVIVCSTYLLNIKNVNTYFPIRISIDYVIMLNMFKLVPSILFGTHILVVRSSKKS